MYRPDCDALIFDLDGTLWDASRVSAIAWLNVAKFLDLNISITNETIRSVSGLPFAECVAKIFGDDAHRIPGLADDLDEAEQAQIIRHGGKVFPQAEEVLQLLQKDYKLFIVSNCQEWYLEAFFAHTKFHKYFVDSLCIGQTGQPKKENIKTLVKKYDLKKAIYVGDTKWDQEAAFFAGVKFIFAAYGFGKIEVAAPQIHALKDLLAIMTSTKPKPEIKIEKLNPDEYSKAKYFYESVGYTQSIKIEDRFYGAFDAHQMVGLVRLAHEEGSWVLRGMQIKPAYQFLGIGTRLIRLLESDLNQEKCYCLPHGWLNKFYSQIGFKTVDKLDGVPLFLIERLRENQKKYPQLILMERDRE